MRNPLAVTVLLFAASCAMPPPATATNTTPVLCRRFHLPSGDVVAVNFAADRLWTTSVPGVEIPELVNFVSVTASGADGDRSRRPISPERPFFRSSEGDSVKVGVAVKGESDSTLSAGSKGWSLRVGRTVGDLSIEICIGDHLRDVVRIPVRDVGIREASVDHVVGVLGVPDHDHRVVVEWPDSEIVDGVRYSPSAEQGSTARSHWLWRDRRCLVVIMNGGAISAIASSPEVMEVDFGAPLWADSGMRAPIRHDYVGRVDITGKDGAMLSFATWIDCGGRGELWVNAGRVSCPNYRCQMHRR